MPANRKRKRRLRDDQHAACLSCGQPMSTDASHIDWFEVWVAKNLEAKAATLGRELTSEEADEVREDTVGDPCDDCCCGGCGGRKARMGEVCC